ncbi:hypothetical protein [Actinoplanes sp. NPDC051859]|uniref:hypothetical protein n=1 Tax=Actinoplanes sp. NPDC051859 TaxID=3363909 RepID=UPI00379B85C5
MRGRASKVWVKRGRASKVRVKLDSVSEGRFSLRSLSRCQASGSRVCGLRKAREVRASLVEAGLAPQLVMRVPIRSKGRRAVDRNCQSGPAGVVLRPAWLRAGGVLPAGLARRPAVLPGVPASLVRPPYREARLPGTPRQKTLLGTLPDTLP